MKLQRILPFRSKSAPRVQPAQATAPLRAGEAVLVDVRESDETSGGVIEGAHCLPLSDLRGRRMTWRSFLAGVKQRQLIVYCASGMRSGIVARQLAEEGFNAVNGGAMSDWSAAGWQVVTCKTRGQTAR